MAGIEHKKVVEEGYDRIGERYAQELGMTRQESALPPRSHT